MKQILFTFTLLTFSFLMLAQTANITLVVKGAEEAKGNMSVALYDNEDDFPERDNYFQAEDVPMTSTSFSYVFKDVPYGSYAIAVYHDLDKNQELNKSWLGIPKEPYAFSNNARGRTGPPDFEEAMFTVSGDMEVVIDLID
jgi:uncharacterized protein (DUF2141 family)